MTKPSDYWVRNEPGGEQSTIDVVLALPRHPFIGVLDRIRSAHNVGSMFRSADGARLQELVLCGYTPTPPHKHLAKTALRAVESVPWRHSESVEDAIEELKSHGVQVLGLEFTEASTALYEFELRFPVALVVGNEAEGLSPAVLARCDGVVHLPMHGLKSSLNVSVAFGVASYEVLRRYLATNGR